MLRAPNGIRTRVAALKGRNPRPLDDGGPPPPGAAPGKYSVGPIGLPRLSLLEPVTHPYVDARRALEHVPGVPAGEHEAARRHSDHAEHLESSIEQRDGDLAPHAERVHRPRAFEQHRLVQGKSRPPAQPETTLTRGLGDGCIEPEPARTEQRHLSHQEGR